MGKQELGLTLLIFTLGGTFLLAWVSAAVTGCLGPCSSLNVGPFGAHDPMSDLLSLNLLQFFQDVINGLGSVLGTFAASLNPLYTGPSVSTVVNGLITGVAGFILILIGIFGYKVVDGEMFLSIGIVLMMLGAFTAPATLLNQLPLGIGSILTYVDTFFAGLGAYLIAS